MSNIIVPNLKVGDTIESGPINTFINSVNSFTAAADNFKVEGIDRRNLQSQITFDYATVNQSFTHPNVVTHSNRSFLPITGTPKIGPVTVSAGQSFHVCYSFNFFQGEPNPLPSAPYTSARLPSIFTSRTANKSRMIYQFLIGATTATGLTQFHETKKMFSVAAYSSASNKYINCANACTLELMQKVDVDTTITFELFGKISFTGHVFPIQCCIDEINSFFVRYLV